MTAIDSRAGRVAEPKVLDASDAPSRARKLVRKGDVIYSCVRPYLLNGAVIETEYDPPPIVSTAFAVMNTLGFVVPRYLWIALRSPFMIESVEARMRGQAYPAINDFDFGALPFPLPPLKEQERIVQKDDELMTLCDRPEAAQTERERRRDLVSTASERRIAIARDATGIAGEVRSYLGKLQFLTKSPGRMSSLRSAIFHAVVRSALATPAQTFPADVAAKPRDHFGVRWPIRRLDEVAEHIVDCPHSTPKWTEAGKICVRTNQFRPGYLDLTGVRYVSEATYRERVQRLTPKADDILYSREGGILGVACRVPPETELCLGQRMMLIRPSREVDPRFLEMILNSPPIYALAKAATTGGAAPRVNVATVQAYPIPVPPLPQQREIVAKVNELMALSQKLEAFLTEGQARRSRLLHAVIRQALDAA